IRSLRVSLCLNFLITPTYILEPFFLTKKSVGLELFPNPHYDFYSIIFRTNKCLFLYTITVTIASITPETKKTLRTPTQSANIPITRDATPNTPVETALKDV